MKQKVKAITELANTTNINEARHVIGFNRLLKEIHSNI